MNKEQGRVVAAATDGACSGNPGPGGWGALIRFEDGSVEEFGGFEPATTNNRMELQAALAILEKLKTLPLHPDLRIRTDSKYLIDGFSKWMVGWKLKGWRTSAGKPVLNQDLWQELDHARLKNVSLEYVKGHSGDTDNDRVDEIAVSFSKRNPILLQSTDDKPAIVLEPSESSKTKTELAPTNLHHLLTRLEMVSHFAEGGYGLTLSELADLLDQPLDQLKNKVSAWEWRDWIVEPLKNDLWRLRLLSKNTPASKKDKDD